ncbi:MAG: hypothetical protein ACHQFW_01725 [Chitinophagales bacterium]
MRKKALIRVIFITLFPALLYGCFLISFNPRFSELTPQQQQLRQPEVYSTPAYQRALTHTDTVKTYEDLKLFIADEEVFRDVLLISKSNLLWVVLNKNGCNYFEDSIASILNLHEKCKLYTDLKFVSADSWFVTISYKRHLINAGYTDPIFILELDTAINENDFNERCRKFIAAFDTERSKIIDEEDGVIYNLIFNEKDSLVEITEGMISETKIKSCL